MKTIKKELDLRVDAHRLLVERKACVTLQDIASATGLKLSWVKAFHLNGATSSASADKIQTLIEYLTGKKLILK